MIVTAPYNNFAYGKVDHDLLGRFDLPVYQAGLDVLENFYTNFKGNAIYRTGFVDALDGEAFEDCVLQEFMFRNDQNYLMCLFANKIRFLSYDGSGAFGWVLDGSSNILEVATPYTLAQCRELDFAQNADVMVITHASFTPKSLTRVSANSFVLADYKFTDTGGSPFDARTVTITGATQANPCVVTATAHNLRSGDSVAISGVFGMTQLNGNTYTITKESDNTFSLKGTDSTAYTAYFFGGSAVRSADYPALCLFYKSRLYFARTSAKVTTVWGSGSGSYNSFDLPSTVVDTSPLQLGLIEIAQPIEWLFGGDNSLVVGAADGIIPINGGSVSSAITASSVQANSTSADGCNYVRPIKKDGLIFYIGQNNRNAYYFSYDLLSESFIANDANVLSYDVTEGGITKLRWKKDRNDLVYALKSDGSFLTLNFNKSEKIIGWHVNTTNGLVKDIAAITNNDGNPQLFALVYRNEDYYIERISDTVQFSERTDFYTGDKSADSEAYGRYVAQQMMDCVCLDGALIVNNLKNVEIVYADGSITAASAVFSPGDVGKHISYKTATGYEHGRFEITGYTSSTVVQVDVLQTPTSTTYSEWYLSFSTVSGLGKFDGSSVGVVADGGYLDDYDVSGGTLDLGQQVLSAVIGHKYTGVLKSFSLGLQLKAENTQATMKFIAGFTLFSVASAGGKVGTDRYRLAPVQELSQNDINYLPPLPMDGKEYVSYPDDASLEKCFYVVQDEPLPLTIACVMPDTKMTAR